MHLRKREGAYHWRRKVPLTLAQRWGRRELVKSLRTADRGKANRCARSLSVIADRLFAHAMSNPSLSPEQIDALARDWFATALEADEEARCQAPQGTPVYTSCDEHEDPVAADMEVLAWLEDEYQEAFTNNDFQRVRLDVERLLADAGVPAESRSETYRRLARALLRANLELLRIAQSRRAGNYVAEPTDPLFRSPTQPATAFPAPVTDPAQSSLPLSRVAELYAEAQERDGKWTADTKRKTLPKLAVFSETLDDKPIDTVTTDDVRCWRQALEEGELSNNTIRLHFKTVAAMFNWAKREGKAKIDTPTRGLMPPEDEPNRDAFSPEELKRLFTSPLYMGHWRADRRERTGNVLVKDFKYWFPLIGLQTGMRVEETRRHSVFLSQKGNTLIRTLKQCMAGKH
jgi:hypothetical protein